MTNKVFFIFLLVLVSESCLAQDQGTREKALVIKNVNVIQMTAPNNVLAGATVILRNSKIEALNRPVPKDAVIIDGKEKWLMPGLIDIHVHIPPDFSTRTKRPAQAPDISFNTRDLMTPFVANGVTTILNLNANVQSFGQRAEMEKGKVIGPRMALAALINGGEGRFHRQHTGQQFNLYERTSTTLKVTETRYRQGL